MSEKIDINVANEETLATISGIGPVLAKRIVEYRQTVHPFEEVIELTAVPGISERMVRGFEHLVTVQPVAKVTAVPLYRDDPEDFPLLDAPEEPVLLAAPPQPEGLLAAETAPLPTPVIEETEAVAAEPEADATPEEAEEVEEVEEVVAVADTAVPLPPPPPAPELTETRQPDPIHTPSPEPEEMPPMSSTNDPNWEAKARRRGCFSTLLGATFGAILGAVLTLAILAALNSGSLTFAESDNAIRQQINTEIISRTTELNQLSTRVSLAATTEAASNQSLQEALDTTNETMAGNEENISYLATRSGDLAQQLDDVAGAAATFTDFLEGLRGLLNDLDSSTATPTPAPAEETAVPTPTPTPFASSTATTEPSATTAVSPTAGAPTRTPQPTATSFTFPTNTPAPQP